MDIREIIGLKSDGGNFMIDGLRVWDKRGICLHITDLGSGAVGQIRFFTDDGNTEMSFMQPFGHMNGDEFSCPHRRAKSILIGYSRPGGEEKFSTKFSKWTHMERISLPEWWGELEKKIMKY